MGPLPIFKIYSVVSIKNSQAALPLLLFSLKTKPYKLKQCRTISHHFQTITNVFMKFKNRYNVENFHGNRIELDDASCCFFCSLEEANNDNYE